MGAASSNKEEILNSSDDESFDVNGFDERSERKRQSQRVIDTYTNTSRTQINIEQYEEETNELVNKLIPFNPDLASKTKKLVVPVFIIIGIAAIVLILTGMLTDSTGTIISLLCIITMTWVGAIIGMIGTYLWGSIMDGINAFKKQNDKYQKEVNLLRNTRNNLKDETAKLHYQVEGLKNICTSLKESAHEFDELREGLSEICGQHQKADDMLGNINSQFDEVSEFIAHHERAHFYSIYYEVSNRDKQAGLSKGEYQRFLGHLDNKTKQLFPPLSDFKMIAGDDNNIDLEEFENLMTDVMEQHKKEILSMGFDQVKSEEKYEINAQHLLKKWGLSQYGQMLLIEQGYDDVTSWNEITREELIEIGFKQGHARKFVKNVSNLV